MHAHSTQLPYQTRRDQYIGQRAIGDTPQYIFDTVHQCNTTQDSINSGAIYSCFSTP